MGIWLLWGKGRCLGALAHLLVGLPFLPRANRRCRVVFGLRCTSPCIWGLTPSSVPGCLAKIQVSAGCAGIQRSASLEVHLARGRRSRICSFCEQRSPLWVSRRKERRPHVTRRRCRCRQGPPPSVLLGHPRHAVQAIPLEPQQRRVPTAAAFAAGGSLTGRRRPLLACAEPTDACCAGWASEDPAAEAPATA